MMSTMAKKSRYYEDAKQVSALWGVPVWASKWLSRVLPTSATICSSEDVFGESSVDPPVLAPKTLPVRYVRRLRKRRNALRTGRVRSEALDSLHLTELRDQHENVRKQMSLLTEIVADLGGLARSNRGAITSNLSSFSHVFEILEKNESRMNAEFGAMAGHMNQVHASIHERMCRSEGTICWMYQLGSTEMASMKKDISALEKGDFFQRF